MAAGLWVSDQLKNEICGRVWWAATKLPQGVLQPESTELLLGDGDGSLKRKFSSAHACLPGPFIEGGNRRRC